MLRLRFADYESTSPQDYEWLPPWASLSLRRLRVYKSTRLQVADAFGFAVASQTFASLSLRRLRVHETTRQQVADALGFAIASQTTRLQDHKPATAPLVVSLTRCLVVWRSQGLVVRRSQGLVVRRSLSLIFCGGK